MKPTPTQIEAAFDAYLEGVYLTEDQAKASVIRIVTAALSVPAEAVVGEPVAYRWKLRENSPWGYSLFARDDVYVCEPLYAAPSAPDGWQPIETAPENASILIRIPGLDYYGNNGVYAGMLVNMGTGRRWMTFGHAIGRDLGELPDAWMPMPAPPALGGSK
ncbi:hypothetical protein [Ensifer adhaerens]|uniref:hypothetical protein n=1 Tax=Ensifer adhaerens TaxID=106592 RepID=UPI000CF095C7|nr:hypothetical protein [Ensifer adhaerens]